jgi:phosphate transport system permease protein
MAQATSRPSPSVASSLRGTPGRRRRESAIRTVLLGGALVSVLISVAIVLALVFQALEFLRLVDWSTLLTIGWYPRRGLYDIPTLLLGSAIVTLIAMMVATPVGLFSAIYLSEYASPRTRSVIKPILEVLAGIPSVVLGFFALYWINPNIVQRFFPATGAFNMTAAGIAVGILVIPLVASVAEDAMRAVPRSLREASYGLGSRRITTSLRVVFPAAISGIVAALILGVSRGIGETMVVAIAAGGTGGALRAVDPLGAGQTITAAMASLATGSDQVQGGQAPYLSLFFLGLLLFGLTLLLNVVGDVFVRRTRQRY